MSDWVPTEVLPLTTRPMWAVATDVHCPPLALFPAEELDAARAYAVTRGLHVYQAAFFGSYGWNTDKDWKE